jgi:hypothetical protein
MLELSLKPQNSTSWLYTTTTNYTNFVSDGVLFSSYSSVVNLTFTSGTDIAIDEAMILAPPTGNWQGYYQSGGVFSSSPPSYAGETKHDVGVTGLGYTAIQLCSELEPTSGGNTGIYQRIYGLEIGKTYEIKADILSPAVIDVDSSIEIGDKTSDSLTTYDTFLSGTQEYIHEFTATEDTADIYVNLYGNVETCFRIKKVRCNEHFSEAELTFSDFEDGSVIIDLYDDNIPLTLSVASFTDATSNLQSYSKDFNLPSTKRNDKVFSHIYDLNTSIKDDLNAFNPYIKTIATLKEDGIEIFSGELSLNTINKNSEGIQYDVNLQSRISGLADALQGKKLQDISFNELDHDFTRTNIIDSWTTGVTLTTMLSTSSKAYKGSLTSTDVVKYPFVDWTGDIEDTGLNGDLLLNKLEDAFRPFVNIKYILDRIFNASGFSYQSDFIDTDTFTKLYMDFNHGGENGASPGAGEFGGNRFKVDYVSNGRWLTPDWTRFPFQDNNVSGSSLNPIAGQSYWDTSDNSFKPLFDGTSVSFYGQIPCYNTTNTEKNVSWRTIHEKNDGTREVIHADGDGISGSVLSDPHETYTPNINVTLALGDSIYFEGKTSTSDFNKVQQSDPGNSDHSFSTWMIFEDISSETTLMTSILNEARGDISQWDFLKSLINMFNLIVSPDPEKTNHLIIEPYDSVFGLEGYSNAVNDPYFSNSVLDSDISEDAGITTQLDSAGDLKVLTDATATVSYASVYYPYKDYIDGETYNAKIVVEGLTPGKTFRFAVQRNGGISEDLTIGTSGTHEFSFVFDKTANGGSNELRVRLYMLQAMTDVVTLRVSEISVIGKFANTIVKKDWSNKIDVDNSTINIMDLDKSVKFTCKKDENDYAAQKYSESVLTNDGSNYNYGDLHWTATELTNITGESNVENKVFSSTIVKSINDYSSLSKFITPAIYKGEDDGLFSVYKNNPRILYDNGVHTTPSTFTSPSQNNDTGFINQSDYLLFTPFSEFSLLSGVPGTAKDLNWRECFSIVANGSLNGLFNEYWAGYYDELYHPDTRIFSVECLLNNNDISNFSFTDIVVIENSEFRVNNINYSSEGLSKIELIKLP